MPRPPHKKPEEITVNPLPVGTGSSPFLLLLRRLAYESSERKGRSAQLDLSLGPLSSCNRIPFWRNLCVSPGCPKFYIRGFLLLLVTSSVPPWLQKMHFDLNTVVDDIAVDFYCCSSQFSTETILPAVEMNRTLPKIFDVGIQSLWGLLPPSIRLPKIRLPSHRSTVLDLFIALVLERSDRFPYYQGELRPPRLMETSCP